MTEAEKQEIVGLVMTQISSQAVDFDIATEQPQANDLLTAVRENESGGYKGVTIKWDDVARIATELANQAATRAEQALSDTTATKTEVGNMKASVEQTVTDFNTLADQKKSEVESVYQTDLNELKGDLDTERNARIEADNALGDRIDAEALTRAEADTAIGARIDSETTTRESEVAELERVNAIQKYEIENLKAKAEGQIYREEIVDANTYKLDIPSSVAPYAEVQKIGGKSVVWNQLANKSRYATTTYNGISRTAVGNSLKIEGTPTSPLFNVLSINNMKIGGHKILFIPNIVSSNGNKPILYHIAPESDTNNATTLSETGNSFYIADAVVDSNYLLIELSIGGTYSFTITPQIFDLTLMFGSGNEPTLEECKKIFSADYYPYNAGEIKSFPVQRVKSVGRNLWNEQWEVGNYDGYGNKAENADSIRSIGRIQVDSDTNYFFTYSSSGYFVLCWYDKDEVFIKRDFGYSGNRYLTSPQNARFMRFSVVSGYGNVYKNDIAIIKGTSGTYSPYREPVILDVSSVTSDLKSAGSVHDEWENGKMTIRVGTRAYTSGDESKSGYTTDGTTTYYPLDTPTEETVPEIDNYIQVEGGGTLTFETDDTAHMPVPSTDRFVVDLTSTEEETT